MNIDVIIYLIVGIVIGVAFAAVRILKLERHNVELTAQIKAEKSALERASATMDLRFKATAQEALNQSSEHFLQLAQEKLKQSNSDGAHDLEKRQKAITAMIDPIHKNLADLNDALKRSEGTDKALSEDLRQLGRETSKLAGALRNPAARGNWGEEMLERLLENSGLIKGVHYELQKTLQGDNGKMLRPDAVINLSDNLHIVIDAKAPVNDFIRNLDEDLDERDYKTLQTGLAAAVKSHIQDLSKRAYWEQLNSPDFVVLFLPSEHLFSAAIQADPSLLELAADKKIVLASPVLTMSLLRVVGMSWRQVELAKNAQEISERGTDLYKRLLTFTGHIEKIGRNIHMAMRGYDEAVGSLERSVLPAARKFKDLQGQSGAKELPELKSIEETPRALTLSVDDEQEKSSLKEAS